ncbi:hypothetical protein [Legionella bononiensis]|uniref:Uncharacterized protein n=1 Tax=Legionella bononiensis TaxID=2793102 RepID=A0ABS1W872_9GAMM|nr:hypothetical protein [Legionella bononiensis]MBL7479926.1 hypothetical protein [Legionella bononiensis]MBL7525559.1 hypothetical protein [Legionella bononiensis]MBL7561743.1 hypothetical protein [Legionella bononiensis]
MSDFKSKLPDFKELSSMTSKLFKGIKNSVEEIIQDYKHKRENQEASGEEVKTEAVKTEEVKTAEVKTETTKTTEKTEEESTENKP